ncbi:hypothetical protein D7Y21_10450 [Corallococcus sp. AB045]|uniref:hypothetical protein n=1 Tax=Corallococcus sp. AB045 TaxID=2316719 RepID=UPI000ECE9A8B|nr:hypothetical protein [Corallococcus sp. AB045]RKH89434.1 hypothetical protein D7Y21_10450 [Corallococcus sp. AB045]
MRNYVASLVLEFDEDLAGILGPLNLTASELAHQLQRAGQYANLAGDLAPQSSRGYRLGPSSDPTSGDRGTFVRIRFRPVGLPERSHATRI